MTKQLLSVDRLFICFLMKDGDSPICIVHNVDPCRKIQKIIINNDDTYTIEEISHDKDIESYNGHMYVLSVLAHKDPKINMGRVVTWYNDNISKGYKLVDSISFANKITERELVLLKKVLQENDKIEDMAAIIGDYDKWLTDISIVTAE